jgi:transcriptional regulator with GAF, ATPase, and Fis domain
MMPQATRRPESGEHSKSAKLLEFPAGRKSAEWCDFEALLGEISGRLIAAEPDAVGGMIESALEQVMRFFSADRCALCCVSDDLNTVKVAHAAYADGVAKVSGEINLARLFPWTWRRTVVERQPAIMSSLFELPPEEELERHSNAALGIRSFVCVPILAGPPHRHLLVINAVHSEREWPTEIVPRLQLLGEILVNALARAKASIQVREQAARIAAAMDAAELGFAEWSHGIEQPDVDDRLRDLLGLGLRDLARTHEVWIARMDAESRPLVAQHRRRLLLGEIDSAVVEYRYEHPQRSLIWLRHSARCVEEVASGTRRIVEVIEDVTERKQALEDLDRLRMKFEREAVCQRTEVTRRLGPLRIVGRGPAIRRTLALAEQVAATNSTVLLLGETGSGKERFATHIHECSRRGDRQMVRVNCSAIPTPLMESELFGREKGAYTGALSKQIGRFELAHGSTLFIDEIGELPLDVQVKLLRVLEERTIERLGNPKPIPVDVRIIAATHRDLSAEMREGRFREDLYYRLNVFPVVVPPLRDRKEDIPLFLQAFVDELGASMGKQIDEVDPESIEALTEYNWPGNVRELRNVVERALIMSNRPVLRIDLPRIEKLDSSPATDSGFAGRTQIRKVLDETGWRIRGKHGAAVRLGIKPTTLESRMKKLGVFRPGAAPGAAE